MKHFNYILIICILTNVYISAPSNNTEKLDSLILQFKLTDNDSLKYAALRNIYTLLGTLDKDTVLMSWELLATYCEKEKYYLGAGYCYNNLARELRKAGEYYKSYENYLKSETYYKDIGDKRGLAGVYNGLGSLYADLEKPEQSFEHYIKSVQLYQEFKDTIWEGNVYLNLGGMLEEQDSLELAKLYLKKSEEILKGKKHHNLLNCYINLGIVYNKKALHDTAYKVELYDTAYYYFTGSYKLSKSSGDERDKFNGNFHLGKFMFEQNRAKEAEPLLEEARIIAENPDNKNILSVTDLADFTNVLSEFYAVKENFPKAYLYLRKSFEYEAAEKLEQAEIEFISSEFEKSKLEDEQKRKNRDLAIIFISVGLLFTLLLLFSVYRSYKHKKRANQLLTEMDELKTRLYSDITHELRTPLTLILGPLEQMLESDALKKPTQKQLKLIRKNANTILNLVNQMLDLSKIEAKSLKLELSEADIVKFIKVRFAGFASLAEQKNISFNRYLPPDKKIRFFDTRKLEKIINNLISNAIKFTPKNGQIFCFASFPSVNRLELIVQDTGKGIPETELSKIFDRFHQVKNTGSVSTVGTGIGLSLTKELVEMMHGKIDVESVVGEGTKFKIRLPLGKEHLGKDEYIIIEQESGEPGIVSIDDETGRETILCESDSESQNKENLPQVLVVDDHQEISEFIKENLTDCYSVETAENGLIGLNKAIENIPDLIVSDLMMPEMDGLEMSRKLKSDERTSHIPIIILTAKSKVDDRLEGLETGADAFLPKPFSIKELSLRIRKLIEQRRLLRERFTKNLKLEPKDVAVTSADEKFLDRAMEIIEENIGNAEFEVRQFQEEMLMSRMQLFRKIKALTNQTPGEFIRTIRLKRAASLMDQKFGNIAQITYEVGFSNPSYFAKCFKELFGKLPSEYMKKVDSEQ